ncbi:MAG: hypothetical protein M1150_02935 [Patescibacteria group bacterium]|nr:hypothetical protein [Patescibacteria group bacterium]
MIKEGGALVAVAICCNRSSVSGQLQDLPLVSLTEIPFTKWPEEDCDACVRQVAMNTTVGHGKAWLEEHLDPKLWPAYVKHVLHSA